MPASSMEATVASSSSVLAGTSTSPVRGSTMSSSATRPRMRSASGWMISPGVLEARDADAVERAAVELGDDRVLRDVDETTP